MHNDAFRPAAVRVRPTQGPVEFEALTEVWHGAVVATHDFLAPEDVAHYREQVRERLLARLEVHVAEDTEGHPLGFVGMEGHHVAMLFVADRARGHGVGTLLLDHVAAHHPVLELDVNEQNPAARGFYESRGFTVTGRSPLDGEGRPFPLLHMRRSGERPRRRHGPTRA
ncbi:GNAT family N-acetyltransferase [Nocardiopsis sp. MG754419]|uniref:GNAT family N-acetyltransferase n=1 Tax=Nocardiopsis sp. MG754419 TaxID=2259865 RepID=UPI001BA6EDF1|nr:GNAT family N-acetyltransferase [Nocardiopsis sp. MG754419]MBR8741185.1 GNAT family N-acetyltransferase [Nocardiopsis sp. MG754419]